MSPHACIDYNTEARVLHVGFGKPQQADASALQDIAVYHDRGEELVGRGLTRVNARLGIDSAPDRVPSGGTA